MKARAMQLIALVLISGALLGCPDTGAPRLPSTPKVPQPKADRDVSPVAMARAVDSFARGTT
jgi:hypothetical protein